ncbi:hypothetical protein BN137_902 [Cronobacter condimenti 1330]|uniref:Uncharacterized protein n=1 Tax=Cronobacter condimenti 1330 TaxID=1073999 RepID=K8ABC7_9ENTR|nr:hypothetical protein BN137_902 [Cronobacter condimenti 1330]
MLKIKSQTIDQSVFKLLFGFRQGYLFLNNKGLNRYGGRNKRNKDTFLCL